MVEVAAVTVADAVGSSGASSLTGVCVDGESAGETAELMELKSSRPGIFARRRERRDRMAVVS